MAEKSDVGVYNAPSVDGPAPSTMRMENGMRETVVTTPVAPLNWKRTAWGAVFAGTVVVLAVQILLSILGVGIGAATINPLTEQYPAAGLGIGAAIWFAITTIIALFIGGWVAARLAGTPTHTDSMLHGVLTWGLSTLVTFYLLTSTIGGLIGGTAHVLGSTLSTAAQTAAAASNSVSNQPKIVHQARRAIDNAANQVEQMGAQAQANAPQLDAQARQAGATAASDTSKAAWATFIVLLLGLIAAAYGGRMATPRDIVTPTRQTT